MAIIGGNSVSAFGEWHRAISAFKVGDEVTITTMRKGNFDRITSLNSGGAGNGSSSSYASTPSQPLSSSSAPVKQGEFPLSMKVSYAKDLLIGSAAGNVKDAVAMVNDLVAEFNKPLENPTPKL